MMISFLDRLKRLLGDVDDAQSEEELNNVQEEVEEINQEINSVDETTDEWNPKKDKKWSKVPRDIQGVILSGNVENARQYIINSAKNIASIPWEKITIEMLKNTRKNIGCIGYFYKDKLCTSKGTIHAVVGGQDGMSYLNAICRLLSEDFTEGNYKTLTAQLSQLETSKRTEGKPSSYDDDEDLY